MSLDGNICTVCLNEVCEESLKLDCGHNFHKTCIEDFAKSEQQRLEELYHETDDELRPTLDLEVKCPICRTAINDNVFVK